MKEQKFVIILRGLPGSGKTTLADALVVLAPDKVERFEADDFFINENNEYQFDRDQIHLAHVQCKNRFISAIHRGIKYIILSNTSVRASEWGTYQVIAEKAGYMVHVITKENYHHGLSSHDVPYNTILRMKKNFMINLAGSKFSDPSYYPKETSPAARSDVSDTNRS